MAGLKCNEDNLIFTAGDNLPTITVLACENIDPDATHRNRALNHRDELAHRLNTGAGLLSLGGMPTGGSLKKNGFKKTPIPPRKPSARAAPKASMTNMLSV
ncbi:hypothetical protein SARC_12058 [Sphaeroforma arctica JP610]|uniref:Uncharacterized protein n=1 Tax=Sphaeroforma arctica JP610 TaxID=667725 RepID=A0A0L0FF59_9EUKA|nr:hypothetical protein SARC_12058 [Sphaeroforma arctica JP610]KNC75414.1 hypothetical protein SARC_12058 [Sphaeroforma arctica JP610]|eukprot:XP_014149316.1 hypothetical protein SARC_12058 [Sphaeroforma arctica JP610]